MSQLTKRGINDLDVLDDQIIPNAHHERLAIPGLNPRAIDQAVLARYL